MSTSPPVNSQLESVSGAAAVTGRSRLVGSANKVQVSLLLNEYSNKSTGSVEATLQASNDGQNWTSAGSISAAFDKAGTVQVGIFPITSRYYRVVLQATPADNTVSYALDTTLSDQ